MDGFDRQEGVVVLAATNDFQALDDALVREGRFDNKITLIAPSSKVSVRTQGNTFLYLRKIQDSSLFFSPKLVLKHKEKCILVEIQDNCYITASSS